MKSCRQLLFSLLVLLTFLSFERESTAQTFTTLYTFSATNYLGVNSDGANPEAGLVFSGNTLYGTAFDGGNSGNGTVFGIETNGMNFTPMHSFAASVPYPIYYESVTGIAYTNADGIGPASELLLSGNTLYGSTTSGGPLLFPATQYASPMPINGGSLFAVNLDDTFKTLYFFQQLDCQFYGALILSGTNLLGTTTSGGNYGCGTVFSIDTQGTDLATLYTFSGSSVTNDGANDGADPQTGVVASGNYIYGTTCYAVYGSTDFVDNGGTVFAINLINSNYQMLHAFSYPAFNNNYTNSDGAFPYAGLVLSSNRLYGVTDRGGPNGSGTIYTVNTDGLGFTNLYFFSPLVVDAVSGLSTNVDGAVSFSKLVLSGNTLYGTTTVGGTAGNGTVFAVHTDGTGFNTLHNFTAGGINSLGIYTNSDGANPQAGLTLAGNALYGTTENGGTNGMGTVFSFSLGPVSPSAPQLSINRSGNNLILTWPANVTGYTLQSTTNLLSPVWTMVAGQFAVTNHISGVRQFFRLSQ